MCTPSAHFALRTAFIEDAALIHTKLLSSIPCTELIRRITRAQVSQPHQATCTLLAMDPQNILIGHGYIAPWGRGAEISDLMVVSEWRGQGVGTALINGLLDFGRTWRYQHVAMTCESANTNALRLYARLGFVQERTVILDHTEWIILVRTLD